jgi:hypothetical protein
MKLVQKSTSAFAVVAFILAAITNANAQTDTIGRNKNVEIERGTVYPQRTDSLQNNMLTPATQDTNALNKNTAPDSSYKNKSSAGTDRQNYKDSLYRQETKPLIKDTLPSTTPVPPDKTKSVVRPSAPPKKTGNPEKIKTTKNKTMYLVPDSTVRKDTLK